MPGTNLTRLEAKDRSAVAQTESYLVKLDVSQSTTTFHSHTELRFSAQPGAATFVDLIWEELHSVRLNGVELDLAEVSGNNRLELTNLAAQNVLEVDATLAYSTSGEGLHRFVDPVDNEVYLYSQFEVADSRRVFAVFEQPDQKATFTFEVTAPAHWRVISNYDLAEEPELLAGVTNRNGGADLGVAKFVFQPTDRISSYITAIVAGPYQGTEGKIRSVDGRELAAGVYARASLAQYLDSDEILEITQQGFDFYENLFGRPYPFTKYDQIFVPEFNAGAMENAGAVTFVESYVFRSAVPDAMRERRAVTILHELAHMWFGDLVTMTWWDDLWLNESFAEFVSTLATAEATKWPEAWTTFSVMEKSWALRQDQLVSTHPVVADMRDLEDVEVNFDGITYAKGASVLRQLVAYVGQDNFFAGIRTYFEQFAWGNTELVDLLTHLEAASGRELREWSKVWLEQAGVTTLRPEFSLHDDGTYQSFAVLQEVPADHPVTAKEPLRPHRLAIGGYDLVDGVLQRTRLVELDIAGSRTEVPEFVGAPAHDLVLVNDLDLTYAKLRLDAASLRAAQGALASFTDSLPRALVWSAAWDAVRDGEAPAGDFIELVTANIGAETHSSMLLTLLRQLNTALNRYVPPAERAQVRSGVAAALSQLVLGAEPGSDAQLQFVKALALHAAEGAPVNFLAKLRSGEQVLPGLKIDADLSWELLVSLVAAGVAGEAEIAQALLADATASGERFAARARAALPSAAAKAEAWQGATFGNFANTIQESTIQGYNQTHDLGLLTAEADRYFAALLDIWAGPSNEMAQNAVVGLYPAALVGTEVPVIEQTEKWLAANIDAPAGLIRMVKENLDDARRSAVVQKGGAQ